MLKLKFGEEGLVLGHPVYVFMFLEMLNVELLTFKEKQSKLWYANFCVSSPIIESVTFYLWCGSSNFERFATRTIVEA